jgi:predicted  nucleic acid-binding Zn-ribbon protein
LKFYVEISPGELIDKITILEIKLRKIAKEGQLVNVRSEYEILQKVYRDKIVETERLKELVEKLRQTNAAIWNIEDDIRNQERNKTFEADFVALARSVYRNNDIRAAIKRKINELLDSSIVEEKSYTAY